MAGFVQWVRQGPRLREVNGKAPNGMQAAVPPHVAFEIVLRVQVGLSPLPDCCLIEQFPDCCKVRAKKFCGIILGPGKDADNYVQTHSGTVPVRLTVVAEVRFPRARPVHRAASRLGPSQASRVSARNGRDRTTGRDNRTTVAHTKCDVDHGTKLNLRLGPGEGAAGQ
jgi:hypothetical protein